MTSIILENIPFDIEKEYGNKIDYNNLVEYIHRSRIKELETKYYNSKDDNYGPFIGAKDVISFLTRKRGL